MRDPAVLDLTAMGQAARVAARTLALAATDQKNALLLALADGLEAHAAPILAANALDVAEGRAKGLSEALLDRLLLNEARLAALARDTRAVVDLPDPVGADFDDQTLPNGLRLFKRRVPLGVVGVIYEARPNVTIDIAALCLKTGNAAILRGGSETLRSNIALTDVVQTALRQTGFPEAAVQLIASPDRALVGQMLKMDRYIDMLIPRGGAALHRRCQEESTIPVITGGIGICHLFVDASADFHRALDVIENAKVQRPSVCNALDTLLVHSHAAPVFLGPLVRRLAARGVSFRVDPDAFRILLEDPTLNADLRLAGPDDFDTEWLSLVLGIQVVDGLGDAIAHIQAHSTQHSDGILTQDPLHAERFVREVDSAAVYVNASTRFTDGGQFGLGAEVAVSTQKLHARGPMGLEALTTYKWVGIGDMHVRA